MTWNKKCNNFHCAQRKQRYDCKDSYGCQTKQILTEEGQTTKEIVMRFSGH